MQGKPHVMIDCETLGADPGCVITSIGAVAFWPHNGNIFSEFKVNISIESCLGYDLTISGDTLEWWFCQAPEAIRGFLEPAPKQLWTALRDFSQWMEAQGEIGGVWAHGATFDFPVLAAAYKAIGAALPWHYRAARDTRTIFDLAGYEPPKWTVGVQHDALADARAQAAWVADAMRRLKRIAFTEWSNG